MKFVAVLFFALGCLIFEALATEDDVLTHAAVEKCMGPHDVTHALIEELKSGNFPDGHPNKNVRCFVKCVLDEFDALDGDYLKEDTFLDYFEPYLGRETAQEYYDACKDEKGEEECETPLKIITCLAKKNEIFTFH